MEKYKIKDICTVLNGRAYKYEELQNAGKYRILRVGNFFSKDDWYYSDMELEDNKYCYNGDLLYAWSANFGPKIWNGEKTIYHYHIWKMVPNEKVDKLFLYYKLFSITDRLKDSSHGSVMLHLTKSDMENFEIELPTLSEQRKIGKILKDIDDKIELNNETNNNLFELMKKTYIEWFKNYNIPDMTFELKDSELGKIPCDWNVKHLKDVFFFQEGPGIRNWQYVEKDGTKFINIRCIKDNDLELDTANMISNEEADGKYKHFMLNEWDVVVSTSGTLGRNQIIRKEHLPLCLNTSVIRFKPINGFDEYAFMYNYLISDEFLNLLDVMATGSAQRNFGPMHLNKIDLVYPDKDIIKKFNDLMFPVIKNIQNNKAENMKLSQLRDTLLPKLMNGEIDLDNIEM